MQILDNIIILSLPVIAFWIGKVISDRYNRARINELEYLLRLQMTEKGVGYIAPQTEKRYVPIGQPFMDKLKDTGRAVQKINPKQP